MKLIKAIQELADRVSKSDIDDSFKTLATKKFNLAYDEVGKSWEWPALETYGSIVGRTLVKGTVTVTTGSRVVNIPNSQSSWAGRFFRQASGENLYRIINVNTTTNDLTLDQDILESGSISFEIEQIFYPIPSEVRRIISFETLKDIIVNLDHNGLRQNVRGYNNVFKDVPFSVGGTDKFVDDYSTGTLSATEGSNIFTGVGTSWLDNVMAGDIVEFGDVEYTVRRVELDTRIISYNKAKAENNGAYNIFKNNPLTVRMRGIFNTDRVMPFNYIRWVHPLVHDNDRTELSRDCDLCILDIAEANLMESLGKVGWEGKLLKAQARLERAQQLYKPIRTAYNQNPPLIPEGFGRD